MYYVVGNLTYRFLRNNACAQARKHLLDSKFLNHEDPRVKTEKKKKKKKTEKKKTEKKTLRRQRNLINWKILGYNYVYRILPLRNQNVRNWEMTAEVHQWSAILQIWSCHRRQSLSNGTEVLMLAEKM